MKYRADIDGLRAIAVISVLIFHAGFALVPGGYIGVDVFFVISGYLITRIISDEIKFGQFSLASFYERRIRRIFPSLFVMIGISFVVAYGLMMPRDFIDFANSVVATSFSASNMLFWWQSGYFDGAAEAKPLLHTWSLAVEEQYYIVFPLLLMGLYRWRRDDAPAWLVGIAAASFVLCVASLWFSPISGFYLAPMRAWELIIGALLAMRAVPSAKSPLTLDTLSIIGLTSILAAVLFFNAQTPFPGYAALLPVLGTAAIIYAGETRPSLIGRFLGTRPLVGIGLISYSLYLWHWPVLVFAEYYTIDELSVEQSIAALVFAFVLAYLSWRFIEIPFRTRQGLVRSRGVVFAGGGAAIAGSALAGAVILWTTGLPIRFSPEVRHVLAASESVTTRMTDCSGKLDRQLSPNPPCVINGGVKPSAFLWGDSHADALAAALQIVGEKKGLGFYYGVDASCPPLMGIGTDRACIEANQRRMLFIKEHPEVKTVVLASRWTSYTEGRAVDFGPAESNEQLPGLMTAAGRRLPKFSQEAHREFAAGLARSVQQLLAAGKRIIIVYPVPETGYNIPTTLARKIVKGERPESFTRPVSYYWKRHKSTIEMLDRLPYGNRLAGADPRSLICDDMKCRVYADGSPLYWDDDHLSIEGARFIAPELVRAFDEVNAAPDAARGN